MMNTLPTFLSNHAFATTTVKLH